MMLLTKDLRKRLPKLYATEKTLDDDKLAVVKLFHPAGRTTWYAVEFDGEDQFFGYCVSPLGPDCDEWGYFSLAELSALRVHGLGVERDLHWDPTTRMGQVLNGGAS